MATYLFTWNPDRWDWKTIREDTDTCRRLGFFDYRWSCGVTKKIAPGDRAFLIKLGPSIPKGIMASGFATSATFQDRHYSDPKREANYVDLRYDVLLQPFEEELLSREILAKELPDVNWSPQASGITIPPDDAARLEKLWNDHLIRIGLSPQIVTDEVPAPERYQEGALRRISVNAYERDPRARKACLAHHGTNCSVCGFNFESRYGKIGEGFIHVHHLVPLSEVGEDYEVDPIADLLPVCPNCHAMLHRSEPPFSPVGLRRRIKGR